MLAAQAGPQRRGIGGTVAPAQLELGALAPAQLAAARCDAVVQEAGRRNRATVAPSVRAAVLARDRHRCAAPGCRSTRFLEVHHVVAREAGGSNRADNLVTLCARCHRFAHEEERRNRQGLGAGAE